ncbi:hypothetical protein [Psychroflexus sp. ALD_RP9]|uniref:hypothetical protein n=1 Tax=Psychroflexus sp. ALD_RP9 TaxID=2777186 RepID=UPI001A8D983F|nr:hypothetical protein [Psychroflexus sp. ALD_RP9]QSS97389.1 hypothetical protein IMZ30_01355 [Psychroflexus sp. ALD_RP9]
MKFYILNLIVLISMQVMSQTKVEAEKRINQSKVPELAFDWLDDAYEGKKRIKWYEQQSRNTRVYEAKFKWKGKRQSIEFDTVGNIINIEIQLKFKNIPEKAKNIIETYFTENYENHRIKKVQIQYLGKPDDLEDLIDEDEWEDITTNYEIEFLGQSETQNDFFEALFNYKGELLEIRVIDLPSSDILKY